MTQGYQLRSIMQNYPSEIFAINFDKKEISLEMAKTISATQGLDQGMFPPDKAIKKVVQNHLGAFEKPSLQLASDIRMQMKSVIQDIAQAFDGYQNLR